MVIRSVSPGSVAEQLRIRPGERLVSINGNRVRDLLDYHFHVADGELEIEITDATGRVRQLQASLDPGQDLGIGIDEIKTRLCGNDCVFCFIDQNPEGMRKTIYVKDEDYRLSFLHGNFVTLTNMKKWEMERIVVQRLTPMYVSVHSTTPETRKRLLRPRVDRDVLTLIDYLIEHEITLHTQIVLCPGYNDGEDLDRTIRDLASRAPRVASLAVVPLGMTDHREGLIRLERVTAALADQVRRQVEGYQRQFRETTGSNFVYLADEFYRMLGIEVPPTEAYDGFPQLENGIGMTRDFLDTLENTERLFPKQAEDGETSVTLVTGLLFEPILRKAVEETIARTGETIEVKIVGCDNQFFGSQVTVAGLLTGGDIARGLEGRRLGDRVFLPPAVLNNDGLFLDDLTIDDLKSRFGVPFEPGFMLR